MRAARFLSGLALGLLVASVGAQGEATPAVVKVPQAEVRSGPSDSFYITNLLRQGDKVQILKSGDNGWVGIAPPSGSFSFVNSRFLRPLPGSRNPNTWVVDGSEDVKAPVLIGSSTKDGRRPSKIGVTLQRGALVTGLGDWVPDSDGSWLSIMPPAGELRWVKAETLARGAEGTSVASEKPTSPLKPQPVPMGSTPGTPTTAALPPLNGTAGTIPPTPPASPMGAGTTIPQPSATSARGEDPPEIAQARDLEAMGRFEEAIQRYEAAGRRWEAAGQPDLAYQCYNRASWLRRRGTNGLAPVPPSDGRLVPVPQRAGMPPSTSLPPNQVPNPRSNTPGTGNVLSVRSSGTGILRRAQRRPDGRPFYYLERNNQVVTWAVPEPHVNLEVYVDQNVELLGAQQVHRDFLPLLTYVTAVMRR